MSEDTGMTLGYGEILEIIEIAFRAATPFEKRKLAEIAIQINKQYKPQGPVLPAMPVPPDAKKNGTIKENIN